MSDNGPVTFAVFHVEPLTIPNGMKWCISLSRAISPTHPGASVQGKYVSSSQWKNATIKSPIRIPDTIWNDGCILDTITANKCL